MPNAINSLQISSPPAAQNKSIQAPSFKQTLKNIGQNILNKLPNLFSCFYADASKHIQNGTTPPIRTINTPPRASSSGTHGTKPKAKKLEVIIPRGSTNLSLDLDAYPNIKTLTLKQDNSDYAIHGGQEIIQSINDLSFIKTGKSEIETLNLAEVPIRSPGSTLAWITQNCKNLKTISIDCYDGTGNIPGSSKALPSKPLTTVELIHFASEAKKHMKNLQTISLKIGANDEAALSVEKAQEILLKINPNLNLNITRQPANLHLMNLPRE